MDKNRCDQLLDYYNGHLDGKEKHEFEQHMQECQACLAEWTEWQMLTSGLPYLSEEKEPPAGMKDRVMAAVFANEPIVEEKEPAIVRNNSSTPSKNWMTGLLAAALLLSVAGNAYLYFEKNKQEAAFEKAAQTYKTISLAPHQSKSSGVASMIKENGQMKLVVHTHNLNPVKGRETYQVWLIEGDKKFRAGTFTPDKEGNGAVVFTVDYEGDHNWEAVAVSHEPTGKSEKPKGNVVLLSEL
ncbi:anti-sigma factor domain-containing protein [Fictibacillus iocasae]|uniref:Regulator of SigK n=1 Tax=Fictibacillus iocasae TaxID=2715437 RepID=A0ABW2NJZ7_9BACL